LASYPKSGNTWLRAFLANYLSNPAKPLPINDLPNHILGDNLILHYEQYTGKKAEAFDEDAIAKLRPAIHQWFARTASRDVFVKTHNAISTVKGTPLITPAATAGAIYVVRNPLDVAVSFAHHYQVGYDRAVESLCQDDYCLPPSSGLLPQYLSSWSRHLKSWTEAPGLTVHMMRYEDMQAKPLRAFGRLIKFLGLPKDQTRLKKAIRFSSFKELSRQEQVTKFVESRPDGKSRFFRAGQAGGWREILTDQQAEALIAQHRDMMVKAGYLTQSGTLTV
jgi:hypothetical protein